MLEFAYNVSLSDIRYDFEYLVRGILCYIETKEGSRINYVGRAPPSYL